MSSDKQHVGPAMPNDSAQAVPPSEATAQGETFERPNLSSAPFANLVSSWATFAGGLLAFATLCGFLLHLSGHVSHATHLASVGVPAELFQKSVELKIIDGYYAIVLQWARAIRDLPWMVVAALFVVTAAAILIMRAPAPADRAMLPWLARRSMLTREALFAAMGAGFGLAVLGWALCVVLLIAIVPGLIGELHGKHLAEETRKRILLSDQHLSEAWKGETKVLQGVLLAVSDDFLAIYDADTKRVRTIERSGLELRTSVPAAPEKQN